MKLPRLRLKGKAWYYDTQAKPRRWIPLGSDRAAALREYARIESGRAAGGTVKAMLTAYLVEKGPRLQPGSRARYREWARHLEAVFGHMAPGELTQADVLLYLHHCPRTSGPSEVAVLSGAYRLAMITSGVTFNPCIGAKLGRPRAKRTRLITPAELERVRAQASPLLRVAIDLADLTGARVSELCRARWDDFGDGKPMPPGKTGVRMRYELTADLAPVLEAARALQGRVACLTVLSERGRPVDRHRIGELWRAACRAADVEDAQFRDLRAKAGTEEEAAGGDPTLLLGHMDRRTTRIYLRGRRVVTVKPRKRSIGA